MPPKAQPNNLVLQYLYDQSHVQIRLYESPNQRIEGYIAGFDEYMNIVLEQAEELRMETDDRIDLGCIILRGDSIALIQSAQ